MAMCSISSDATTHRRAGGGTRAAGLGVRAGRDMYMFHECLGRLLGHVLQLIDRFEWAAALTFSDATSFVSSDRVRSSPL